MYLACTPYLTPKSNSRLPFPKTKLHTRCRDVRISTTANSFLEHKVDAWRVNNSAFLKSTAYEHFQSLLQQGGEKGFPPVDPNRTHAHNTLPPPPDVAPHHCPIPISQTPPSTPVTTSPPPNISRDGGLATPLAKLTTTVPPQGPSRSVMLPLCKFGSEASIFPGADNGHNHGLNQSSPSLLSDR
jgi:hypothetical protein